MLPEWLPKLPRREDYALERWLDNASLSDKAALIAELTTYLAEPRPMTPAKLGARRERILTGGCAVDRVGVN